MKDYRQIIKSKLYRQDGAATLAQDSTDKIKAVKKTVLDFENYLRENVGGFDDAGRKNFEDALQDTTLEILDEIKTADDIKIASNKAVINFGNCLMKKNISVGATWKIFFAMLGYIINNHLN